MVATEAEGARARVEDQPWVRWAALAEVDCSPRGRTLRLTRAWPRADDHLLVEYRDGESTVAGQWFADPLRLQAVARQTAAVAPGLVTVVGDTGVVLQAQGADRRLTTLAATVGQSGVELVAHRPERRAVVRVSGGGDTTYRKLSRPGRLARPPDGRSVHGVRVPTVVAHEPDAGITELTELPGRTLYELLGDTTATDGEVFVAFRAAGKSLATLHAAEPGPHLPRHDAGAEWGVVERWVEQAQIHGALPPDASAPARSALERLRATLLGRDGGAPATLVHRDLHDKQMLVAGDEEVGVLDLDTLAVAEPALDVANLCVHLELRVLQRWCPPARAAAARAGLLDGYRPTPSVRDGLDAYAAATRLRLACVYAFRPHWSSVVPCLLATDAAV